MARSENADAEAKALRATADHLEEILHDEPIEAETPVEVTNAISIAVDRIREALRLLKGPSRRSNRSGR